MKFGNGLKFSDFYALLSLPSRQVVKDAAPPSSGCRFEPHGRTVQAVPPWDSYFEGGGRRDQPRA